MNQAIGPIIVAVLVFGGALWMLGHMIYILFIRKKLRTDWTADEFRQMRQAQGLPLESSDEENSAIIDMMSTQVDQWLEWKDENGDDCSLPLERSVVKGTAEAIENSWAYLPTDEEIVEHLNDTADVVNEMRKRTTCMSKTLVVVLWIAVVIMGFGAGNWGAAITFGLVYTAVYWMASMKPNYVLIKKELEGKEESSFLSGILGGVFGAVAAAPTYRTVTKWSDGSTTTDDDHSPTLFAFILALFVTVVLVVLMPVFSAVNYLRNYVFH